MGATHKNIQERNVLQMPSIFACKRMHRDTGQFSGSCVRVPCRASGSSVPASSGCHRSAERVLDKENYVVSRKKVIRVYSPKCSFPLNPPTVSNETPVTVGAYDHIMQRTKKHEPLCGTPHCPMLFQAAATVSSSRAQLSLGRLCDAINRNTHRPVDNLLSAVSELLTSIMFFIGFLIPEDPFCQPANKPDLPEECCRTLFNRMCSRYF